MYAQGCLGKEVAAAVASGLVAASVAAGASCCVVPGLVFAPTEQMAVAKAADAPTAWVAAAMGLAEQEQGGETLAFAMVPTTAGAGKM